MLTRTQPSNMLTGMLALIAYGVTALAFSWFFADWPARLAASSGAMLGVMASPWLIRLRLRSLVIVFGTGGILAVALALRHWLLTQSALAGFMGLIQAVTLLDAGMFFVVCFCSALAVHSLAQRHRMAAVCEWIIMLASFAHLLAAHRHGAINRPFAVADPLLAQGYDPAWALLGVGACVALLSVLLLIRESRWWRMLMHAVVLCLILGVVLGVTHMAGLPPSPSGGDSLGLRGKGNSKDKENSGKENQQQHQNDAMEFRDNYDSDMDRSPVAVVLFHDDYSPPQGVYYFRQNTFSQYNGRRLVTATRPDVDLDVASGFPSKPMTLPTAAKPGPARKRMETTMALLADHARPPALEAPFKLVPSANHNPARFRRTYQVTSAALNTEYLGLLGARAGSSQWTQEQRAHYLRTPEDPRYAKLAEEIIKGIPQELQDDPVARAVAVTGWLSEHGIYSLRHGHAKAADPTADFLFGDKTGYCIHFAHAATYLMRQLGLPTRVATGYAVNEESRQGGSALLLSGADSHAWPEVYYEGIGWVVMDIFPQRTLDKPPPPPDPDLQRLMGELLRGQKPLFDEQVPSLPDLKKASATILMWIRYGTLAVVFWALLILYGVKYWRRWVPKVLGPSHQARLRYRAALDRLAEQGHRRYYGETREAFAERMAQVTPSFAHLSQLHMAARFGSRALAPSPEIIKHYQQVMYESRQGVPWYGRLWQAMIPWSWLKSR